MAPSLERCAGLVLLLLLSSCTTQRSGQTDMESSLHPPRSIPEDSIYDGDDWDSEPKLLNIQEMFRAVESSYPDKLKRRGIGGTVLLAVVIDPEGNVVSAEVHESSGSSDLDEAALEAIGYARFVPVEVGGVPVYTRIMMPITYSVRLRRPRD